MLAVVVIAAILTPPDVFSQLMLAGPMLILYEVSIWVAALVGKKKARKAKAEAEAAAQEEACSASDTSRGRPQKRTSN